MNKLRALLPIFLVASGAGNVVALGTIAINGGVVFISENLFTLALELLIAIMLLLTGLVIAIRDLIKLASNVVGR